MLARLAPVLVRRRRLVLVLGLLVLAAAGFYGGGVANSLQGGGFDDPSSESSRAAAVLEDTFGQGQPDLVFVATAAGGDVDASAARDAGQRLTAELAAEAGVSQAASYWTLGSPPPLKSAAGDRALVLVRLVGDEDAVTERAAELGAAYQAGGPAADPTGTLTMTPGGSAWVNHAVSERVESDLLRAEMIAIPITLVLLVVVFGSVVAATLPLAVGILSIFGTFAVLQMLSSFTDVSIFSLNLTTALGLGLAIDYSLFVVSRFREELGHGYEPGTAVIRTVRTAGRTVLFSAATVAISLAAMLVFPITFLKSFAYAGIAVSIMAAIGAVVVLPALLAVLGHRVNKLRIFRRPAITEPGTGVWHRVATLVMRRPVPIATVVIVLLLILGAPFLGVKFGLPDDRVLPPGDPARAVQDVLREEFTTRETSAIEIVVPDAQDSDVAAYAASISEVPGIERVDALTGSYVGGTQVAAPTDAAARFDNGTGTWLSAVTAVEPMSAEGEAIVNAVRATPAPFETLVGGPSAELVDAKDSLFSRIPLAAAIIAITTFVVLFLLFGSLLVPIKAVILNLLSLTATFGAMVWIFQDGNLAGLLDITPTGTIAVVMPILMFCIAFGLSMDYEVFLLSRIKEEHDRGADTTTSVSRGLERTGRIVTAAAVLIAVVFIAFATSGVAFIKLFGIGLTLAVLVDAFLIRATLVPAFMKLAGDANWWAPGPLRRLHNRIGISETVDLDDDKEPDRVLTGV